MTATARMTATADPRPSVESLDADAETYPMTVKGVPGLTLPETVWACCVSKSNAPDAPCQHRAGMQPVHPYTRLMVGLRAKTTTQLLGVHAQIHGMNGPQITAEHRMVAAYASTVIEDRYDLHDAMVAQFEDDDDCPTYHDALLIALAQRTR